MNISYFRQISICVTRGVNGGITSVSECGAAVLISLNHWCGLGGLAEGKQRKCNTGGKSKPNLKEFCTDKGSDGELQKTLENVYKEHVREGMVKSYVKERINGELNFLKDCLNQ